MLLFLFTLTFATEMCVYKKVYDDEACTVATVNPDYSNAGYRETCVTYESITGSILYYSATCTNDDDINIKTCFTEGHGCDCAGDPHPSTCDAALIYNEGKYEKYVCEPCDELDCHIDDSSGMDLNPNCRKSTGEPIEGEFCLQQRFWNDRDCTVPSGSMSDYLFDMTCRTDVINNSWKGKCTMDADGNIVTATAWSNCDTNSCDDGEDHVLCPTEGINILGKTDCGAFMDEYASYACVPCDEPICGNEPSFMDDLMANECGSSASSLMMMFATFAAALLF